LLALSWLAAVAAAPALADPAAIARIDSLNALGHEHVFSHIEASIERYAALAEEARALDHPAGEARARHLQAVALYLDGQYDRGVAASLAAIRIFEQHGLVAGLAQAYGDLGYQMKRRDLPQAMAHMRHAIALAEAEDLAAILTGLYDNFGVLQELADAPDSAAHYYRRALALKTARADSVGIPYSLNHLAGLHLGRGELAAAESLLTRSDAIRTARGDAYGLLVNRVQWGDLAREAGDLAAAMGHYRRALAMPGAATQTYLRSYCYEQLAAVHAAAGDHERAYRTHRRFAAYRDSLVNVQTNARIAELEVEFETERKDRELAESRLAIATRNRQLVILAAVLGLVAAAAIGTYRYQVLERRQLARELELRGRLRRAEYEQRLADEKLRISRELHDNVGAQLTFLVSSLDNLARGAAPADEVPTRLGRMGDFGRTTLQELRQTVWAMRHEGDGLPALAHKLHELKRQCADAGQPLELEIPAELSADGDLSSVQLLNLYRVAQEAVQNAIKHAGATRLVVSLASDSGGVTLRVADDGRGCDPHAAGDGSGLTNMRQRCQAAGGTFDLRSGADGTVVTCQLPAG
jgi:signal transduction histidine kinase